MSITMLENNKKHDKCKIYGSIEVQTPALLDIKNIVKKEKENCQMKGEPSKEARRLFDSYTLETPARKITSFDEPGAKVIE